MEQTDKKKEVYEWRTCIEKGCGREFYISVAEKEFFDAKKGNDGKPYALPKRCYGCRVKRRDNQGSNHEHKTY